MVLPRSTFWSRRLHRFVAWGGVAVAAVALGTSLARQLARPRPVPPSPPASVEPAPEDAPAPARPRAPVPAGNVLPARSAVVRSAVQARVLSHSLAVGRAVQTDQELVVLDDAAVVNRIRNLEASLASIEIQRATHRTAIDRVGLEKDLVAMRREQMAGELLALESRVEHAAIRVAEKDRDLANKREIQGRNPGAVSSETLRQSEAARAMAVEDHETARIEATILERKIDATRLEIALLDNQVERLRHELALLDRQEERHEADLALARHDRQDFSVHAPFGGIVARRDVEVGVQVMPGEALFEVVEVDRVRVEFFLSPSWRVRVETGREVSVESDVFPGSVFRGRLVEIAPRAEERTHQYRAVLELEPGEAAGGRLWPGMVVRVLLEPENKEP